MMKDKEFFSLTIKERVPLTKPGSTRTTWHITLTSPLPIPSFRPGDSLAIVPQNSKAIVEQILRLLKVSKATEVREKRGVNQVNFYDYLLNRANIHQVPLALFRLAAERGLKHREERLALLQPEARSVLQNHLASFELWDFLQLHVDVNFTPQEIVDHLLPLLPRFYSIASSPLVFRNEIHLTVGHVSYESGGHTRYGVGSHFLCYEADTGMHISSYIQHSNHFHLPEDLTTPIIMIGPGTGVAPFKAFLEERKITKATGKNWLFFGERNRPFDFYYEEFLLSLEKENRLKLSLAFSRDLDQKVYVQHLMAEQGEEIVKWLDQGAWIYVCGDAKEMAKGVDHTLQQIIKHHYSLSEEASLKQIKQLKAEKRYLLDVY